MTVKSKTSKPEPITSLPADEEQPTLAKQPKTSLAQFLLDSTLSGSGLNVERQKDAPRPIKL